MEWGGCCAYTFLAPALNLARTITLLLLMTLIPSLIFLLERPVAGCSTPHHARLIFSSLHSPHLEFTPSSHYALLFILSNLTPRSVSFSTELWGDDTHLFFFFYLCFSYTPTQHDFVRRSLFGLGIWVRWRRLLRISHSIMGTCFSWRGPGICHK